MQQIALWWQGFQSTLLKVLGLDTLLLKDAVGAVAGSAVPLAVAAAGLVLAGAAAYRAYRKPHETLGAGQPAVLADGNKASYLYVADAFVAIHGTIRDRMGDLNAVSVLTLCTLVGKPDGLTAPEIAAITRQNPNYTYTRLTTTDIRHHLNLTKPGVFTLKEATRKALEECLSQV